MCPQAELSSSDGQCGMAFAPSSYKPCNRERVTILLFVDFCEPSFPSCLAKSNMASLFSSATFDDLLVHLWTLAGVLEPLLLFSFFPFSSLSFGCPVWDALSMSGPYIRDRVRACLSVGCNSGLHVFKPAMCSLRSQRHK